MTDPPAARIERNHDYPPFKYIVSFEQSLAAFLLARGPFAWCAARATAPLLRRRRRRRGMLQN